MELIRYSFYSYLAPNMFSFLKPIVLKGIIPRLIFFQDVLPINKNADTFVATSDQISAKSNEAFGNY